MLDAFKAFDRVSYCKLVRLLTDKKMSAVIVHFLLAIYISHLTSVIIDTHSFHMKIEFGKGPFLALFYFAFILTFFWADWAPTVWAVI
jgi:hypothetical protein